jgi:chorismate mutase
VANTRHVEDVLRNHISVVWIGARTTVNPFLVREIAEALRGAEVQVMIKNPVNPDLELWIGAIERFAQVGFENSIAIHRGFSQYGMNRYRNEPAWQIPLELKRRMPHLPLICDPSHIAGKRDLLLEVAQKAIDLGYDGLMIETHHRPDEALSDRAQQITPEAFKWMLQSIIWRKSDIHDPLALHSLEQLRLHIDSIDYKILQLIAERMQYAEKIGEVKKEQDIQIFQPERWNEIVNNVIRWSQELNLSQDIMAKLYDYIHQESIRKQSMVMYGRIINQEENS